MSKCTQPCLVTAHLLAPIAGDVPMLDGLLELLRVRHLVAIERDDHTRAHQGGIWLYPHRGQPAPPEGRIPIPVDREPIGGRLVAHVSSPIYTVRTEWTDRLVKRLDGNRAADVVPSTSKRQTIHHGSGATKAYYKPIRVRLVDRVVWFVLARSESRGKDKRQRSPLAALRALVRKAPAIGKHIGHGYGRCRWTVEPVEHDYSWFAPLPDGRTVLMRPLPEAAVVGRDVVGYRLAHQAITPPYWHYDRYASAALPC